MNAHIEDRIKEIGTEIFELAHRAEPGMWHMDWWQQRMLEWIMQNERLKVQLFRFVDLLPTLRTDAGIARHLQEYLTSEPLDLPGPLKLAISFDGPDSLFGRVVGSVARFGSLRMASSFVAGTNVREAIDSAQKLRHRNMAFTLDILGESTISEEMVADYQRRYIELIDGLTAAADGWDEIPTTDRGGDGPMPRVNISIKLSALCAQFDPIDPERSIAATADCLRPVLRRARDTGAFINIDMESFAYKDLTLDLFERILSEDEFRDWPDIGLALQAYLTSATDDLRRVLDWVKRRGTRMTVRLVKGAYWDHETVMAAQRNTAIPVWTRKWESDVCFEQCARILLENTDLVRPAFASHNVRSIAAAIANAEDLGLTRREYEIQMLFGMGNPLKTAISQMGYCLRIYTPYGDLIPGMAYLIRRLLENTSNDSFLKQSFGDRASHDFLLASPSLTQPPSTAPPRYVYDEPEEEDLMPGFVNEPDTGFSNAANRDRMAAAIKHARGESETVYPLFIDGQLLDTHDHFDSINPSHPSEIVGRVASASSEDAERAIQAAGNAFDQWRNTPGEQRARIIRQAAEQMRERRFELAALAVVESGKPWREADADVSEGIDYCNYYALCMQKLSERPNRRDLPGETNLYVYEPCGTTVILSNWNFPLALLCNMTAAALVTGNCVIIKPSSAAPVMAAKLVEILHQQGVPPGAVNFLPGPGATLGKYFVDHPQVHVIAFTGARETGLGLIQRAAVIQPGQQHIKHVIAEMGGKNAIIVDDDADLNEAVEGVATSAFGYSGQKCSACSRVIVHREIYDAFLDRLVQATRSLRVGPADDPGTFVSPVIDAEAGDSIRRFIEVGKQQGRCLLEVDTSHLNEGFYVGPVIIADVDPTATIFQEEIFGPVLAVTPADTFERAVEIANATSYALTGGVYSRSPGNIDLARREFAVGNLYINRQITGSHVHRQPFGGFRMSGVGVKGGGPNYIRQYCQRKTVTENTLRHGLVSTQEVEPTP